MFGPKPAEGWDVKSVETMIVAILDTMFEPGRDWIDFVRNVYKGFPFHGTGGDPTPMLATGGSQVGTVHPIWYLSLARLLAQSVESVAGFTSSLDGNPVTSTMFLNQGLVTIESGLTDGRVSDLGSVTIGLLDIPPVTGRAVAGGPNYMHVQFVDLLRWSRNIKVTDVMIRQNGAVGDLLAPSTVSSLKLRRLELNYFGARRVYLAMLEALLLLECEGELGPGGGLGFDQGPVSFPGERPPLPDSPDMSVLLGSSPLGTVASRARDGDEVVVERPVRRTRHSKG